MYTNYLSTFQISGGHVYGKVREFWNSGAETHSSNQSQNTNISKSHQKLQARARQRTDSDTMEGTNPA